MELTYENILKKLKEKNLRLSYHRLKVLDYLVKNRCHPTVDQVYTHLHKEASTLSKTTVYNILNVLAESGIVKVITIEGYETRYDIATENHGHFKCESCGNIYDFSIDIDSYHTEELKNFRIISKDVYFKGLCPGCKAKDLLD